MSAETRLRGLTAIDPLDQARVLAVAAPAALLAAAYGFEFIGGLFPCDMCYWQRWAHMAALGFAVASFAFRRLPDRGRSFVWLAALFVLVSGGIGVWHAGIEAGIFPGATQCAMIGGAGGDVLQQIMAAPLVRCDEVQWSFLAISMAGWNAIVSIGLAMVISWLSITRAPARR